jgi:hypothetical protein
VAGESTPGPRLTPVAPEAGSGVGPPGGSPTLTLAGFLLVAVSLFVLIPSGVSGFDRYRVQVAERRVQRYLDELEAMGRELAGPGRGD